MLHRRFPQLALSAVFVTCLVAPVGGDAATDGEHLAPGHTQFISVVTKKVGALVVTTPNGATHQLNENMARRYGQEPFKGEG